MVLSDTGDHTVYLVDCRHFDREGWETGRALLSITSSNSDHLDMVCPSNDESLVVLPFQGAFEQFCSRGICSPINISYPLLGGCIVYFDALTISSGKAQVLSTYEIIRPSDQIPSPFNSPNGPFSRMYDLLLIPQPSFFLHNQISSHSSTDETPASFLVEARLERNGMHRTFVVECVLFRTCQGTDDYSTWSSA